MSWPHRISLWRLNEIKKKTLDKTTTWWKWNENQFQIFYKLSKTINTSLIPPKQWWSLSFKSNGIMHKKCQTKDCLSWNHYLTIFSWNSVVSDFNKLIFFELCTLFTKKKKKIYIQIHEYGFLLALIFLIIS